MLRCWGCSAGGHGILAPAYLICSSSEGGGSFQLTTERGSGCTRSWESCCGTGVLRLGATQRPSSPVSVFCQRENGGLESQPRQRGEGWWLGAGVSQHPERGNSLTANMSLMILQMGVVILHKLSFLEEVKLCKYSY